MENEELEECHDILIACKHSLSAAQFEYLRFRLLGTPQDLKLNGRVEMNTSETISKLAEALSLAQGQMTGAKKSSANPFFKSKYSDLSSVVEAISKPFADNGLSFIQSPGFDGERVTVTTRIMHKSGEWIEGTTVLPPTKNDAQGYGSAITYAKRYGLQGMAGVPSVDDDGNEAVAKKKHKAKPVPEIVAQFAAVDSIDGLHKLWEKTENRGLYAADKDAAKERLA